MRELRGLAVSMKLFILSILFCSLYTQTLATGPDANDKHRTALVKMLEVMRSRAAKVEEANDMIEELKTLNSSLKDGVRGISIQLDDNLMPGLAKYFISSSDHSLRTFAEGRLKVVAEFSARLLQQVNRIDCSNVTNGTHNDCLQG